MATKGKNKGKGDPDKKSSKKIEDTPLLEERKEDSPIEENEALSMQDPTPEVVESPQKEPTPEPVYDEPPLTDLIVESYDGEKENGLFEGEGQACFTGGHEYKGNFSQGMMHGRGKYTWCDGVTYEGDFAENKVTGKGAYHWIDGSSYDGDVYEGMRHGFGVFRCKNNKMSYHGDWALGKKHGKGRMNYDPEGASYHEGDWVQNIRHGWGIRQYPSGNVYQGMWYNNIRHGEGTMRWLDRDQMYSGQWDMGIQHGMGQHIWFLRRASSSQYPLRNMYDGEFVRGKREGYGTFYYANGARYEGQWKDNMKHGKGKFVFKNGREYEGLFEKDHIVEYPSFSIDGMNSPDLSQIRTRTPLPMDTMSIHSNESKNTLGPSFQLEIDHLLSEMTEFDREEETNQVMFVLMRHMTSLKRVFYFYSRLGYDDSPDNTFIMSRMQFWRFLKDCHFHHKDITVAEMDRVLAVRMEMTEIHNPYGRILFREFVNHLITLAYRIYREEHELEAPASPILPWCMEKLMVENILKFSCKVMGNFYYETRRAVNALVHMDQAYNVYQTVCKPRQHEPNEPSLKMRQFLFMLKDFRLINNDLTPKAVITQLAMDDPAVTDEEGSCNMELEMTFLEFFEALVGCAETYVTESVVKDPSTPRPSTILTAGDQSEDQSIMSPSHAASNADDDEEEEESDGGTPQNATTPETSSPVGTRGASSVDMATKAAGDAAQGKPADHVHPSNTTAGGSVSDDVNVPAVPSEHTHISGKKESVADLPADQKRSGSHTSLRSHVTEGGDPAMVQSLVSVGAGSDVDGSLAGDGIPPDEDEEELDEATRQFNFWTHQVHIFFVRKFFPAAEKMSILHQLVQNRMRGDEKNCDCIR